MPSAPLVGKPRFASPLFAYKKLLKFSSSRQQYLYTAKDNEKGAIHLITYREPYDRFVINRWYLKQKVNQQNRLRLEGLYECVLCASCTGSCPMYWWNREYFLGPAVLLQAYRWLIEPLDRDFDKRVSMLEHGPSANMCHNIFNCSIVCPKYLNPGLMTKEIKRITSPCAPRNGVAEDDGKGL